MAQARKNCRRPLLFSERARLARVTDTEFRDARRAARDALLHVAQHGHDPRAAQAALGRLREGWKLRLPLREAALVGVVGSPEALAEALAEHIVGMEL